MLRAVVVAIVLAGDAQRFLQGGHARRHRRTCRRRESIGACERGFGKRILAGVVADQAAHFVVDGDRLVRSEEHTSELQSLMRISYAVFCLKKKKEKVNI